MAGDGPLLILAGPGSGKTTVLTARIAHLVAGRSISPKSVLALTFGTKAAREIRARLVAILGDAGGAVDVATFHSFGLRVIRQWCDEIGLGPSPPVVYDAGDGRTILTDLYRKCLATSEQWSLADVSRLVERYRLGDDPVRATVPGPVQGLAEAYEAVLQRRNAVDYPAMLALPLRLFARYSDALDFLQRVYRYVLVDEFQDVCGAQYRLVSTLAARHRNLVVVGDPAQTVYTWRGADVRFVQEFLQDFPEARVLSLDNNFRSTGHIVELANALGRMLPYRRPLRTDNPDGEPGFLVVTADEHEEARFVAAEIVRLGAEARIHQPGDVAILYRTNQQASELTLALRERGLRYRLRGHADLFARREVRDAIAYLRLAHDPSDVGALARVVNVPPRGLGRIAQKQQQSPITLAELSALAQSDGVRAARGAEELTALVGEIHARARDCSPADVLTLVLARSGYRDWLAAQPDGPERLANLEVLTEVVGRASDLTSLLDDLGDDETSGGSSDDGDCVVLSTIHGAKGGEWQVVFVVGMEEGLLPLDRARSDQTSAQASVEDENRVAYVAVTRPRERLYLTCCMQRRHGSRLEPRRPSRFLSGLPLVSVERAA